jgi:hypothetical protein
MRFSQTRRDLSQDPGAFFSPKLIVFSEAPMTRRQFHKGVPANRRRLREWSFRISIRTMSLG